MKKLLLATVGAVVFLIGGWWVGGRVGLVYEEEAVQDAASRSADSESVGQSAIEPDSAAALRGLSGPRSSNGVVRHQRNVVVIDARTERPVEEAEVASARPHVVVEKRGEKGTFRIEAEADIVPLRIQHLDYEVLDLLVPLHGPGELVAPLHARRAGTLRVRDRLTGQALVGAQASLAHSDLPAWTGLANAEGIIAIPVVRAASSADAPHADEPCLVVRVAGYLQWMQPLASVAWRAGAVDALMDRGVTSQVLLTDPNGTPIADGRVVATSSSVLDVQTTGPDGRCDVLTAPAMQLDKPVTLWCGAAGFCDARAQLRSHAESVTVVLAPFRHGTVRVLGPAGDALQGASVDARAAVPPFVVERMARAKAVTNREGIASLAPVATDAVYAVSVAMRGHQLFTVDLTSDLLFDGTEIRIPPYRIVAVHVTDRSGRPVPCCRVLAADPIHAARAVQFSTAGDDSIALSSLAQTDDRGRAEVVVSLDQAPATFVLVARGYAPASLHVAGDAESVSAELAEGLDLVVRVVDRAGRPVFGASVELSPPVPLGRVRGDTPLLVRRDLTQRAATAADGTASLVVYGSSQGVRASIGQSEVGPVPVRRTEIENGRVEVVLRPLSPVSLRLVDAERLPIPGVRLATQVDGCNVPSGTPDPSDGNGRVSVLLPTDGDPNEEISFAASGTAVGNLRVALGEIVDGAELELLRVELETLHLTFTPTAQAGAGVPVIAALARGGWPVAAGLLRADQETLLQVPRNEEVVLRVGGSRGPAASIPIGLRRRVAVEEPQTIGVHVRNSTQRAVELVFVGSRSGLNWATQPIPPGATTEVHLPAVEGGYSVLDRQLPVRLIAPLAFDPRSTRQIVITERALEAR